MCYRSTAGISMHKSGYHPRLLRIWGVFIDRGSEPGQCFDHMSIIYIYIPDVILIIRPKQVSECTRTVVACTFMSAVLKTPSQYISDVQLRQDKSHPEEEKPECLAAEAGIVKFHHWLLTCFDHEICIYYGIYIYIFFIYIYILKYGDRLIHDG